MKQAMHSGRQLLSDIWRMTVASTFTLVGLAALGPAAHSASDFLEPELAFKASVRAADARSVELVFDVAPGYYLYRERFAFTAIGATLGTAAIPQGKVRFDETFGRKLEIHRGLLRIRLPVQKASGDFKLSVTYQGCADKGLCYPPSQLDADVSLTAFGGSGTASVMPQIGSRR